jgi:hypothetical protein
VPLTSPSTTCMIECWMDSQSSSRAMEWRCRSMLHAFDHAAVEVREELTAQGGRSALLSADFDVGALTNVGMGW